jgi:2'-5' RNA ligase
LTLRFLGDAEASAVTAALDHVRARTTTATLGTRTRRLGRGVICIDVSGLDEVAAAVIEATAALGKPPEHRDFFGHLTLARVNGSARPPLTDVPALRWPVATFALVRSHLGSGPAHYETVATWPLQP